MADLPSRLADNRRPSRLGAVWLSYRTRWLLWILASGVGFVFVSVAWSIWSEHSRSNDALNSIGSRSVSSAEPSAPFPSPSAWFDSNNGATATDWLKLRSLNLVDIDRCRPLWTPGAIPRLESLVVLASISDSQLEQLCSLYDLNSLTLYVTDSLTADGLRPLKNETRLEYLRIVNLQHLHDVPSLEWPPNLRTLICDDTSGIPLPRLNEWRRLPRLTSLSTRLLPVETRLPEDVLESLGGFPSLRYLYLQELGPHANEFVSMQQSALPKLRVRPSSFDPVRGQRAAAIHLCGLLVSVVLLFQMSSQFLTSASVLTPGFARSHLIPVAAVSVLLAFVSFCLYVIVGCSILVSIGMCTSVLLLASEARLLRYLQSTSGFQLPGFVNPAILIPCVVFPVAGIQLFLNVLGAEFDWFLRGEHPWLAVTLLAGSLWGAFDLVRWHVGLQRDLEESGGGNVPLNLDDFRGWAEWGKNMAAARAGEERKPGFALRRYDARLEQFVERMRMGKSTSAVALWRLGGNASTFDWLRGAVMFLIAIGVLAAWLVPESWSQSGPLAAGGGFQILGGGLIMPLLFAWQRRPMQEMELLRPAIRRDWACTWFQAVASEIAPVLLVAVAFGAAMLWSGQLGGWSAIDAFLAAVILVGAMVVIFAVGMWTLTLRSMWLISLVGGIAWIFIVLCVVTPTVLQMKSIEWRTPIILVPTIVSLYTMAFAGLWLTWRSWQNWEVGRVT